MFMKYSDQIHMKTTTICILLYSIIQFFIVFAPNSNSECSSERRAFTSEGLYWKFFKLFGEYLMQNTLHYI